MEVECSGYRSDRIQAAEVGAASRVEGVGIVEGAEVVDDAVPLNEGVLPAPLRGRGREVRRGGPIAAEALRAGEAALQAAQVVGIEDEAFEVHPPALVPHLDPAVDDASGRQAIRQPRDRAALQCLVDRETVEAARHSGRTEQRHQQRALGVALADAVGQHARGGQLVALVVAEGDLVAHEVVGSPDSFALRQRSPVPIGDQALDVGIAEIEKRRRAKEERRRIGHCSVGMDSG